MDKRKIFTLAALALAVTSLCFAAKAKVFVYKPCEKHQGVEDLTPESNDCKKCWVLEKNGDGYWTAGDVKRVCKTLISECIANKRIANFEAQNGRPPLVTIGTVKNLSSEFIDTSIISDELKNAVLNSGVMEFLGDKGDREAMRDEIAEQQEYAAEAKELAQEDAADFMLVGTVKAILSDNGKTAMRTYFVTLEANDLQSHRTIWNSKNDSVVRRIVR